jgi:hypothetical protein
MIGTAPELIKAIKQRDVVERTFSEYADAIVTGNWQSAYDRGGNDFRAATPFDNFVSSLVGLQRKYGKLLSVKQKGLELHVYRSPEKQIARISADHQYEKRTISFVYEFHFEDGRWALYGFEQQ